MLQHLLSCIFMVLFFALAAAGMWWLNGSRAALTENLLFEEEYSAEITTLKLN